MSLAPIIVMSFNRPPYLQQVLQSLAAQQGCGIGEREIFLFQDGGQNPFSQRRYGDPELFEANMELFASIVPFGTVMPSPINLGVALNFDRAERFVFEERQDRAAIFLEDDMVLSPHYIATLDRLIEQHADDHRIGYLAAYGDHMLPLAEQRRDPSLLLAMHHNWAFALFRRSWLRMRPHVTRYLDLVRDIDYRQRSETAILDLYTDWGFGRNSSSQDAAKTMACVLAGIAKIKTRACLGRYIGERGLHMSPRIFEQRGFARTEMYSDTIVTFEPITDVLFRRVMAELTRWAGKPAAVKPDAS